jgi:nucleoside-diphosphate-sugar epimerase
VRTLITGGAGFLGSHLAEALADRDDPVTVADSFDASPRENLAAVEDADGVDVVDVDFRDEAATHDVVAGHDRVYHLAAKIGGVGYLRDRPADIIADNDLMNKHVFDACVEHDVDRIVYASSSMVYSESDRYPHAESQVGEIPPPRGSYGFQKLNGEYYCDAYQRQYGLEYVAARIFNGVGPRDWPEETVGHGHVVPDMVKKIVELEQDPVEVKGSGQQTRCFTDVRDLVSGLVECMETEAARNQAFNLGSTEETSIEELVERIWRLAGPSGEPRIETADAFEKDVERRVPDISKARERLGWEPTYDLDEILETYIEAYERRVQHGA